MSTSQQASGASANGFPDGPAIPRPPSGFGAMPDAPPGATAAGRREVARVPQHSIPAVAPGERISPKFDPLRRLKISNVAKWIVLFGVLFFFGFLAVLFPELGTTPANKLWHHRFATAAAVFFAAIPATCLPRLFFPNAFGRWHEAVEAFRDWLYVSVVSGGLYFVVVGIIRGAAGANSAWLLPANNPTLFDSDWMHYRLPFLLGCAVVGSLVVEGLARRGGKWPALPALVVGLGAQVLLVGLLNRPLERGFDYLSNVDVVAPLLLLAALLCGAIGVGVLAWSYGLDKKLMDSRASGVVAANGEVPLTITVIGGSDSGKTVLMAAAYHEWDSRGYGDLEIRPSTRATHALGTGGYVADKGTAKTHDTLKTIAKALYGSGTFPAGTAFNTVLDFDLLFEESPIAHFSILDFPGKAILGDALTQEIVDEFWKRVDNSDGVIFIVDGSALRRSMGSEEAMEILAAYQKAMRRLSARNKRNRVVPIAMVLTKCDEWVDPDTGYIDTAGIEARLIAHKLDQLEQEWISYLGSEGPRVRAFTRWLTTAITYSKPHLTEEGVKDYKSTFDFAPEKGPITPTGCAAPLMWMTSQIMRWNVTLFRDFSSFFFGSSPQIRRRIEAIQQLERESAEKMAS